MKGSGEREAEVARNFLREAKSKYTGLSAGGVVIDDAVNAVFSALIWHTQTLREELEKTLDAKSVGDPVNLTETLQQVTIELQSYIFHDSSTNW